MNIVAGLIRVSTLDQLGLSLPAQQKVIEDYCKNNLLQLHQIYIDKGESASIKETQVERTITIHENGVQFTMEYEIKNRHGFKQLIEDAIAKKFDTILITKWDRFSRDYAFNVNIMLALQKHGVNVIAIQESNEEIMKAILSVFSQEEIRKIKSRMDETRKMKLELGHHVYKSLYGYKGKEIKINGKDLTVYTPDGRKSKVVQAIFEGLIETKKVAAAHFAKRFSMTQSMYYSIISHIPFYAGYINYHGTVKKGQHQALLTSKWALAVIDIMLKQPRSYKKINLEELKKVKEQLTSSCPQAQDSSPLLLQSDSCQSECDDSSQQKPEQPNPSASEDLSLQ